MEWVKKITVETAWTPTIVVDTPFAGKASSGLTGFFMRVLKPKVTIDTALGRKVYAPEGEPGDSARPILILGAALFVGWLLWR